MKLSMKQRKAIAAQFSVRVLNLVLRDARASMAASAWGAPPERYVPKYARVKVDEKCVTAAELVDALPVLLIARAKARGVATAAANDVRRGGR